MEHLVSLSLKILNQGTETTFVTSSRKETTDFTLGTNDIGNQVIGIYLISLLCQITGTYTLK